MWWWAFGYFAAYAPYSLLTKALSDGRLGDRVPGNTILPVATLASVVSMVVFLASTGWWKAASRRRLWGIQVPFPTRWTALSGLCGATILTTTTLAYTIDGVSIVFMMLLMRGGVLAMAPIIDMMSGRKVSGSSWVALALTSSSLVFALLDRRQSLSLTWVALADVGAYLLAYFIRLRFMSKLAKTASVEATRRYFVEEQLVSAPAALLALVLLGLWGGPAFGEIRDGFTSLPWSIEALWVVVIGVLSQGTGVFGALVLLDQRENSFSVPVNRASSVLAGVVATASLSVLGWGAGLGWEEGVGAALVMVAIAVLSRSTHQVSPVAKA